MSNVSGTPLHQQNMSHNGRINKLRTHSTAYKSLIIVQVFGIFIGILLGMAMPHQFSKIWQSVVVAWIIICVILHLVFRYFAGEKNDWLSLDKLFIVAYLYFHYDYLLSYLVGITNFRNDVFVFPNYANLTTYLISFSLLFFLLGYNLYFWRYYQGQSLQSGRLVFHKKSLVNVLFFGKFLILLGFGLVTAFIIKVGYSTLLYRSYGFSLFYSGLYDTSLFAQGKQLIAIGSIFFFVNLLEGRRFNLLNASINVILFLTLVIYALLILLLFSVRAWLFLDILIPGVVIYHYLRKRINVKWVTIIVSAALIFSVVVELSRTTESRNIDGFVTSFQENIKNEKIGQLLSIQWRTYKNVNESLGLVDRQARLFYGLTFIGDFFDGIPFVGSYINKGWYESPSLWLARNMEPWFYLNHEGIGFSFPAETYINFGLIGSLIVFFFLGYICAKFYFRIIMMQYTSLLSFILYTVFMSNLLFAVRQTLTSVFRPIIISLLVTLVVYLFSKVFPKTILEIAKGE